jgi:3',5'-cyclic AMP phosphodiesterase CpdA
MKLRLRYGTALFVTLPLLYACGDGGLTDGDTSDSGTESGDETGGDEAGLPPTLPPLSGALLTTDETIVLPGQGNPDDFDPRVPADRDAMISMNLLDTTVGAGEPIVDVTFDGSAAPAPGSGASMITRFMYLADTQVPDDESPTRLCGFDTDNATAGAFRAQDAHACHVVNAAVRTINALHLDYPMDFVLLGGDNADSAQRNEVLWFRDLLDGGVEVHCDSGDDDDPVPGENNDPKDPLVSEGLAMPWKWVTGNHDILVQGNLTLGSQRQTALGSLAEGGTRDWSQPGGPVVTGMVPADPQRELVNERQLMELISETKDGHGITQEVIDSGRAQYVFDQGSVRVIVISTAAATGASEGVYAQSDVDAFLRDALDEAEADGQYVIVTSHHAGTSLGDGTGLGGNLVMDALTPAEFQDLLGEYSNVIMHLAGHSHEHQVLPVTTASGHQYWQVRSAAIADHPNQMRMVEVSDEDNGFLAITGIAVDYSTEDDSIAADGRVHQLIDYASGWGSAGAGTITDRNTRLWVPKP